jgi:hypothetical protein
VRTFLLGRCLKFWVKIVLCPILSDSSARVISFLNPFVHRITRAWLKLYEHLWITNLGQEVSSRTGALTSAWRDPLNTTKQIPAPSEAAIQATIAYCDYIYQRYGRFPAYSAPFRTVLGYQATHVDIEFYDLFYKPEALSETQRKAKSFT